LAGRPLVVLRDWDNHMLDASPEALAAGGQRVKIGGVIVARQHPPTATSSYQKMHNFFIDYHLYSWHTHQYAP